VGRDATEAVAAALVASCREAANVLEDVARGEAGSG
jgi:hypothetical protein